MVKKIAIITGASSGVGAETARLLAKNGFIPIMMARSIDKLKQVSATIESEHEIYQLDVTSSEQVTLVIKEVLKKYKQVDILINNAGFGVFGPFYNSSNEDYYNMINTNYMGTVRCTKAILSSMIDNKEGHIINIASIAGIIPTAKSAGYAATKSAVIGFSKALRQELKNSGVKVSVINPGPIKTPFFDNADPTGNYVKKVEKYILKPEQVAEEVLKVISTKKNQVNIPVLFNIGVKFYNICPNLFEKSIGKFTDKK